MLSPKDLGKESKSYLHNNIVTQHHQMRHKSHTKVLCKWQIKEAWSKNLNRVLLRNSKEIMLFSIFSGIYYRVLGFRCVLHRFYY